MAAARRQVRVVIIGSILGLALGIGYLATAVPQFTAAALVMLDNRRVRAVQESYDVAIALGWRRRIRRGQPGRGSEVGQRRAYRR